MTRRAWTGLLLGLMVLGVNTPGAAQERAPPRAFEQRRRSGRGRCDQEWGQTPFMIGTEGWFGWGHGRTVVRLHGQRL